MSQEAQPSTCTNSGTVAAFPNRARGAWDPRRGPDASTTSARGRSVGMQPPQGGAPTAWVAPWHSGAILFGGGWRQTTQVVAVLARWEGGWGTAGVGCHGGWCCRRVCQGHNMFPVVCLASVCVQIASPNQTAGTPVGIKDWVPPHGQTFTLMARYSELGLRAVFGLCLDLLMWSCWRVPCVVDPMLVIHGML